MDRFARLNPQRGRLVWAAAAIGAVTIVALTMMLADVADTTEVVATLLVAPVCVVALLMGRTPGLVAAGVATVAYATLRQGDMDDAGGAGVAVLVLSRAAVYGLVAYATPILANRLPSGDGSAAPMVSRLARHEPEPAGVSMGGASGAAPPTRRARELDLHGWVEAAGGDTAAPGEADEGEYAPYEASAGAGDLPDLDGDEELPPRPMWEEPLDPELMTPPAGVPTLGDGPWEHGAAPEPVSGNGRRDAGVEEAAAAPLVPPGPGAWDEPERPVTVPVGEGPPAPTVPTGWIDDATTPLGDESIPVGYTGELFLPSDLGELPLDEPAPPAAPPSVRIGNGATHRPQGPGPGARPLRPGDASPLWEEPPPPSSVPQARQGRGRDGDDGWVGEPGPDDEPAWGQQLPRRDDAAWTGDPADRAAPAWPGGGAGSGAGGWASGPSGAGDHAWAGDRGDAARAWADESAAGGSGDDRSGRAGDAADAAWGQQPWSGQPPVAGTGVGSGTAARSGRRPFERPPESGRDAGAPPDAAGFGAAVPGPAPGPRRGSGPPVVTPPTTGSTEVVSEGVDPETRLWNARFFRDRLNAERDRAVREGGCFSVVMIQVPDAPFQPLPYRRQVALLRELGHQFIHARLVDHLVHLPDGAQHWFAVVLGGTDRSGAHLIERRLRSAIGGYLRSRGLQVGEIQSASLTSPDDDEAMSAVWSSLLGTSNAGR